MKPILRKLIAIAALGANFPMGLSAFAAEAVTHGENACKSSESWTFSGAIRESFRSDFKATLRGSHSPVRGFSEALAMRRFAQSPEAKTLGEYWISRALYDAKLQHIAFNGFVSITSRPLSETTSGIQISALECMLHIQNRYPSISLPESVTSRLSEYRAAARTAQERDVVWQAASSSVRAQLAAAGGKKSEGLNATLELLKGAGAYEDFAHALRASRENDHNTVVTRLDKFLTTLPIPSSLARFNNASHLMMARHLYSLKQFDRANHHLKLVSKASNELADALSEMSWAFLMNDRLSEAIGTAMNLQAGGLRHTFAPEAPMVMAMALNELCQYPESVHAINVFRKNYEKPYNWLKSKISGNLYPDAVQYVRRAKEFSVPDRIASEWVRSPLFIASQDELNLLFDESEASVMLGRQGAREQTKMSEAVLSAAKGLAQRLRSAKGKMKAGEKLPPRLRDDLLALKESILRFRRLQQGAPTWHAILTNYKKLVPITEARLVATVNADLKARSQRMLEQLDEIAENIQLIEVEIYNGASQDIIWQNAHPDYKKVAQTMKGEGAAPNAATTWDWGRAPASLTDEDAGEVWEDELGSFNANLYDNCSSKDKYLAIKAKRLAKGD